MGEVGISQILKTYIPPFFFFKKKREWKNQEFMKKRQVNTIQSVELWNIMIKDLLIWNSS